MKMIFFASKILMAVARIFEMLPTRLSLALSVFSLLLFVLYLKI